MARHSAGRIGWRLAALAGAIAIAAWAAATAAESALLSPALVAAGAVLLAGAALLLSLSALRRVRATEARLLAMARTIDRAWAPPAGSAAAIDVADINRIVALEIERAALATARAEPIPTVNAQNDAGAVVPIASPRPRNAARSERAGEDLVTAALARGTVEISLRPVVSLAAGAAVAFDTFAHLGAEDAPALDIHRLRHPSPTVDAAAFEALLVRQAVFASRRVVAGASGGPLHVAISAALLRSQSQFQSVATLLRAHNEAARALRLDIPAALLVADNGMWPMLDALRDTGAVLVADHDDDAPYDATALGRSGIRIMRMPAERLLGRRRSAAAAPDARELARLEAGGISVIADGADSDEEAMALVDIGIDLMTGKRFSGPLRLRRDDASQDMPAAAE